MATEAENKFRLPLDLKAVHYDLAIKTDLKEQTFEGIVKVHLDVVNDTNKVVFNSADLDLGKAEVTSNGSLLEQTDLATDKDQERIHLTLGSKLSAGSKALLKVPFKGVLTGSMMGYYKSSWTHDGKTEYYSLTQFEPTASRRAFPSWDEPALKSTFAITMISREETVSLSNMPATSESVYQQGSALDDQDFAPLLDNLPSGEKWKVTKFQTTPKMSTYIVAWANGPFKHIERKITLPLSGQEIPLRVYATEDLIHQTEFALDVKARVLPLYEKIFDVGFPLPKLDTLIAHDFDAGAMENWGLITGRQKAFCLDPNSTDLSAKKYVAAVQSHECAHMWFGNITTMEWWSTLWLNESFATLMGEVIIPDRIFPEWKVNSEFINDHLSRGLALDAKLSSHPVEVDVQDANKINQIFDSLSYSKGGSVLRMLSSYATEEGFLKGVSLYLKDHLYGNTKTHDLWEGISKATGIDIPDLMDNWITKIGFPLLTVTEQPDGIVVRQDRFLETGKADEKDNQTIWNVPLGILTVGADGKPTVDRSAVLKEREQKFSLDTSKPYKLNAGTTGFYRTLYSPERLSKIGAEAAKSGAVFSLDDRMGLIQDATALSKAGLSKLSATLTLINLFRNEKEYLVWLSIRDALNEIVSIWWEHPEIVDKINALRRSLFVPLVQNLGYEYPKDEPTDKSLLRSLAISNAAKAGDEGVNAELKRRFDHFKKTGDDSQIVGDLLDVAFSQAVKLGDKEDYETVLRVLEKPKTPTAASAAMRAIGATQDDELLKQTFDYIMTKSRDQDVMFIFAGLEANFKARRELTNFFEQNYDTLYKRFEGNFSLKYIIEISYRSLTAEKDTKRFIEFFKGKDTSKFSLSYDQILDTHRAKIGYIERSTDDLSAWLKNWEGSKL